jgi:ABC-type nitrate/sulfonate/bicarbonate transport system permease component
MRRLTWIPALIAIVAAWQAWIDLRDVPDYVAPAPTDIARVLWDERSTLGSQALVTLREMLAGFAAAAVGGLAAAVLLHRVRWLRGAVYPLLVASQSIPIVAIAPLLVIGLGFGLAPKIVIVALVCFLPVTVNALDGFAGTPADLRRTMRTLNASPRAIFWRVELPWAAPRIFSGARIAAAYAAIAALFGEYAGGSGGLADSMHDQLDTGLVGAAVVVLAALALALFGAVILVERLAVPWAREE